MLPRHARCVLSRLRCNGHSLLLSSYFSRIGKIKTSSCSACGHSSQDTSHLILHFQLRTLYAARSLATLSLRPLVHFGKLPGFWGSMVSRHAPMHRKGSGNNYNNIIDFLKPDPLPEAKRGLTFCLFYFGSSSCVPTG